MADVDEKISVQSELTAPATDDVYPIVDTSVSTTKKITQENLVKSFFVGLTKITVSATEPVDPSTGDLWVDTS